MTPKKNLIQIEPHVHKSDFITLEKMTMEKATVVKIGPDVQNVRVGEVIIYKSYSPDIIEVDGVELTFISEDDVKAGEEILVLNNFRNTNTATNSNK